ncbi:hypothetical protein MSKU15_0956 [Komagataeibacter diospyri]|nr:hypothetical protein MSKU15_0956 [Komagataeibacter diospyri]
MAEYVRMKPGHPARHGAIRPDGWARPGLDRSCFGMGEGWGVIFLMEDRHVPTSMKIRIPGRFRKDYVVSASSCAAPVVASV